MTDPRVQELLDLAEAEGITLPYPPEMIIAQEDLGNVVDLNSGDIVIGEADQPYTWEWTAEGEALAHVWDLL